jgi:hypothetical protein
MRGDRGRGRLRTNLRLCPFHRRRQRGSWPFRTGANLEQPDPRRSHRCCHDFRHSGTRGCRDLWGNSGSGCHACLRCLHCMGGLSHNRLRWGRARASRCHRRLCRYRLSARHLCVFSRRPDTSVTFPFLCSLSTCLRTELQTRPIGYTGLLKNSIHLTSIRYCFNTNLILSTGITANKVHCGKVHPHLEALVRLLQASGTGNSSSGIVSFDTGVSPRQFRPS